MNNLFTVKQERQLMAYVARFLRRTNSFRGCKLSDVVLCEATKTNDNYEAIDWYSVGADVSGFSVRAVVGVIKSDKRRALKIIGLEKVV